MLVQRRYGEEIITKVHREALIRVYQEDIAKGEA
jgi:hypothetical protein